MHVGFYPQSDTKIDLGDWLNLLTLCLAPLVVHVIAGVPSPTYLDKNKPKWHDKITHYNPTSIQWRYFAIVDRRIRSKSWTSIQMAASNAIFWTAEGWNGSEEMMLRAQEFLTRVPSQTHIGLMSLSSATTFVIALQGMQALYVWVAPAQPYTFAYSVAVNTIFLPLAMLGLLRLPAALWLSTDFSYADHNDKVRLLKMPSRTFTGNTSESTTGLSPTKTLATMGILEIPSQASNMHSPYNWRGLLVRIFFPLPLVAILFVEIYCDVQYTPNTYLTLTQQYTTLLYHWSLIVSIVALYSNIFRRQRSTTTIIPCIASLWYKIATLAWFLAALGLIIVAALETKKTHCGRFTTLPQFSDVVAWKSAWLLICWGQ